MKRAGVLLFAVLLIGAGYVAGTFPWRGVTAQEDRAIPVIALREQTMLFPGQKIGDACDFSGGSETGAMIPGQLIAKDPSGQVKGYSMVTGTMKASGEDGYYCAAEFDMSVKIDDYVSIYFRGEYIRTYAATDFPISLTDGIYISMRND